MGRDGGGLRAAAAEAGREDVHGFRALVCIPTYRVRSFGAGQSGKESDSSGAGSIWTAWVPVPSPELGTRCRASVLLPCLGRPPRSASSDAVLVHESSMLGQAAVRPASISPGRSCMSAHTNPTSSLATATVAICWRCRQGRPPAAGVPPLTPSWKWRFGTDRDRPGRSGSPRRVSGADDFLFTRRQPVRVPGRPPPDGSRANRIDGRTWIRNVGSGRATLTGRAAGDLLPPHAGVGRRPLHRTQMQEPRETETHAADRAA